MDKTKQKPTNALIDHTTHICVFSLSPVFIACLRPAELIDSARLVARRNVDAAAIAEVLRRDRQIGRLAAAVHIKGASS